MSETEHAAEQVDSDHDGSAPAETSGRRRLIASLAGAAAAGVAGAAIGRTGVAEAADGGSMIIGQENGATQSTVIKRTVTSANNVFTATDGNALPSVGHFSEFPAAVGGFAYGLRGVRNGVYGLADAVADDTTSGYAGVFGIGTAGRAPLRLFSAKASPMTDALDHAIGELTVDASGNMWVSVVAGLPGTWRKLQGPDTAGALHAIDPIRVYDSRQTAYSENGMLAPEESRVVSVADSHDVEGAVLVADVVPAGATAVSFNLTVAKPTGSNFLSVTPGDATGAVASSINFDAGRNVANGLTGKLDGDRQIKVFCGDGAGSCHFIVDVNGYYL